MAIRERVVKRCAATRDGRQCTKRAPHSGKHYALAVGYWGRGKELDDATGDGQLMRRMDEARALLLAHGLTLYGFDPGVTCFDDAGGRCLDFPGPEWQQFRRALVMLYGGGR